MTLQSLGLSEYEIELLFEAVRHRTKFAKAIGNSDVTGHGKASEWAKREAWKSKAEQLKDLESKLTELTI